MDLRLSRRYIELGVPGGAFKSEIKLDGMTYDRAGVRFDVGLWTVNQAAIVGASIIGEGAVVSLSAGTRRRREFSATSKHLEVINANHTETDRELEDFHIFQRVPVNDVPSRTIGIKFTTRALEKFAADANEGRARLRGHNKADIVGRTFAGEVVEDTVRGIEGNWLLTTEYISARTVDGDPMNRELITQHVNGELAFDSIGFYPGSKIEFKEFEAGERRLQIIEIDHDPGEQFPLEMREVSFVHLGELRGVGSRLQSLSGADDNPASLFVLNQNPSVEVSRQNEKNSIWVRSI